MCRQFIFSDILPKYSPFTIYMCVSDVSNNLTFTCDFEDDETGCIFHNAMGDNFDWTVYTVSNVIYLRFYFM